jgi:prepilin-type N-terminal cleavage/methylation domain-containing protein/prepilin-type processing-associated H-X9-DG protein
MKRPNRRRDPGRKAFTLLELLVVLFLTAIIAAIVLPTIFNTRNRSGGSSNRVKCGSNLRQIGQAILLYTNENKGNYPRTFYVASGALTFSNDATDTASPRHPFGDKGLPGRVADNDVTAAMFLLIRTQDITPEVFVCPSSNAEMDRYGSAPGISAQSKTSFTNWRKNLSYSLANPYPEEAVVREGYKLNSTTGAEFAIAADINPGVGNPYDVTIPTESSSTQVMQRANSPNHQGQGQNVLYGDGHATFEQNPFCGAKRDNIYTVSGSTDGSVTSSKTVVGSPRWAGDSVLLPPMN